MTPYNSRWLGGFVLALMLGPSGVQAQAVRSFEELQQVLKTDEMVVVTDATDQQTTGRVVEVSAQAIQKAQPMFTTYFRPEVFVSYGRGGYLADSTSLAWPNIGGGVGLRLSRRWGAEFEINRMQGVSPGTVSGIVLYPYQEGMPECRPPSPLLSNVLDRPKCVVPFEGRSGFTSMALASANMLYYFSDRRVQPFLSAGLGVSWERGITSFAASTEEFRRTGNPNGEEEFRDTYSMITWGGGIRVPLTRHIAVRPEFKNYGFIYGYYKASIAAAYQFGSTGQVKPTGRRTSSGPHDPTHLALRSGV